MYADAPGASKSVLLSILTAKRAPIASRVPDKTRMTAPLFTVLIDTFNYGRYIAEAVRSVLQQDFPLEQVEILVVDDGSTDDTEQRLEVFGDAIRYLKKSNGGQASAFNFGLGHARGELVALLDADDAWLPNKLARMHAAFLSQPDVGMAYHRIYEWKGNGELSTRGHFIAVSGRVTDSRFTLLCYPMMQTSTLVFRRQALEDLLPIPETLRTQADAYLTALIIFICPVLGVDEYLAKYRIHGANLFHGDDSGLSKSQLQNRTAMREALVQGIIEWLSKHGHDTDDANIRDYLKQWKKAQEADTFRLQAPGRWKYFQHLVEFPVVYRELMTGRQLIYSYVRAFAALLLGYGGLHHFDDFYAQRKNRAARLGNSGDSREGGDAAR
jgi:glycosyltransferase involved in cell wall biosynthesis